MENKPFVVEGHFLDAINNFYNSVVSDNGPDHAAARIRLVEEAGYAAVKQKRGDKPEAPVPPALQDFLKALRAPDATEASIHNARVKFLKASHEEKPKAQRAAKAEKPVPAEGTKAAPEPAVKDGKKAEGGADAKAGEKIAYWRKKGGFAALSDDEKAAASADYTKWAAQEKNAESAKKYDVEKWTQYRQNRFAAEMAGKRKGPAASA